MSELKLFTDASVNPKLKIGYGACLLISQTDLLLDNIKSADNLKSLVKIKKFEKPSPPENQKITTLFIGGVEDDLSEKDIIEFFTKYGKIKGIRIRQKSK